MTQEQIRSYFLASMRDIQQQAFQNSVSKGFWTGPDNDNVPTKLCLMHSEISEWLEGFRKGNPPSDKKIVMVSADGVQYEMTAAEEEAADLFIRLLDLCGHEKIDLGQATLAKMKYNAGREYMHGGKKC